MIRLLLILMAVCTLNLNIEAKGIEKMYVQRTAADENLFYIFSQDLPALPSTKSLSKKIQYDFTYTQRTDSVAMIMSVKIKNAVKFENIKITADDFSEDYIPEIIYVKPSGSSMNFRIRIMLSFSDFEKIYNSPRPFILALFPNNSQHFGKLEFGYDSKNWGKHRADMLSIINIIKLNTSKE